MPGPEVEQPREGEAQPPQTPVLGQRVSWGMVANTVEQFSGKFNAKIYFEKVEQRSKLDEWSEQVTLNIIKYRLTGDAYNFFKTDPTLDRINYTEFKARFIKRFSPVIVPGQGLIYLNKCYQRHDESVNQYVTRIKLLGVAMLEEDIATAEEAEKPGLIKKIDQLVLNQFKTGLSKHLLKNVGTVFMREENLTIDKAEEFARQEELNDIMLRPRPSQVPMNAVNEVNCFKCGRPGHYARDCNQGRQNFRDFGNSADRNNFQGNYNNFPENRNNNSRHFQGNQNNNNRNLQGNMRGDFQGDRHNNNYNNRGNRQDFFRYGSNNRNDNRLQDNQYRENHRYFNNERSGNYPTPSGRTETQNMSNQRNTGVIPRRPFSQQNPGTSINSNNDNERLNSQPVPPYVPREGTRN